MRLVLAGHLAARIVGGGASNRTLEQCWEKQHWHIEI